MAAPTGSSAWRITRLTETGSTNADARAGALAGTLTAGDVLVAEHQTAGRGRLDRSWVSAPGQGLTFSALVRPAGVPDASWGWLPLLAGLAVDRAATALAMVPCKLKWPNDVLAPDGKKLAGVLCERVDVRSGPLAVIGIGVNVGATEADLPVPGATSLALAGMDDVDPDSLLTTVLDELGKGLNRWCAAGGDALASGLWVSYRMSSATIGSMVTVTRADSSTLTGTATDIDPHGALLVRDAGGTVHTVAAGDITHLRGPERP